MPWNQPDWCVSRWRWFGPVRVGVKERGTTAEVYLDITDDEGPWRSTVAWEMRSAEAVALIDAVWIGDCPLGVLADYLDEHPESALGRHGADAAQKLRTWMPWMGDSGALSTEPQKNKVQ